MDPLDLDRLRYLYDRKLREQEEHQRRMVEQQQQEMARILRPYVGQMPWPPPLPTPEPALVLKQEFVAGPIVAWRLWKVRDDGHLVSVAQQTVWPAGRPLGTKLMNDGRVGIYAMKTREMLAGHSYGADCVVGQVAVWGKVIEHERGYRAEYAYPLLVDLSPPMPGFPRPAKFVGIAAAIRDLYGCQVVV